MRFLTALVVTTLTGLGFASPHSPRLQNRHAGVSRASNHLERRFDQSRFSFYAVGLGACGKHNSNGEFVVALNAPQFDADDHCFQTITVSYKGKSHAAQIVDRCADCPYGSLDFSPTLFNFLANPDDGIVYGSWNFGTSGPKEEPKPEPKTTTTEKEPEPTPTPKPKPKPTPSTTKDLPSDPPKPSVSPSKSSSSPVASASPQPEANNQTEPVVGTLGLFNQALLGLAGLYVVGMQADSA